MINLRLFLSCLLSLILRFIASESILKKKETPSYIPSELWTMCLVAMEITYPLASWTDKHDTIPRFPVTKKNVIIPYVVNHLYNLYGTHWWRLQCIISWLFWLWIMAVTWLYLPLTFSRLSLRNLGMWAWAHTFKIHKVFTEVGQGPWLKRKLCLGLQCNKPLHYPHCPSEWVCVPEHLALTMSLLLTPGSFFSAGAE